MYEHSVTDGTALDTSYYSFAGSTDALRAGGAPSWILTDHQGSSNTLVDTAFVALAL